jgi:Kef-type K+ transport system membrane component KefB
LTPVAALTWCFGFAALAGIIGLSPAFGAFFAGLLIGSSAQRHAVGETARPIQSVLLMVFFLSIGLLIDLNFLWENIGLVLMLWLFIVVFKTALNTGVLRFMGEPWRRAFLSWLNNARRVQHRAAQHPATLGALLRLIYFREWRLTRRASVALAVLAIAGIEKAQTLVERIAFRRRKPPTAPLPKQEVLPPLPPPDPEGKPGSRNA